MIFLPLEVVDTATVCEEAFFGGVVIISEAIWEGIFRVVFGKREGTLSIYSRSLNESANVVGIFCHR